MMIKFKDIFNEATIMSKRISQKYHNKFEPDELLNESWIMSGKKEFKTMGLFLNRLKWDMEHYVRNQRGSRRMIKGKIVEKPQLITNCDFNKLVEDKNLKRIEDDELLEFLLKAPSEREIQAIEEYFLEELPMAKIGINMRRSESVISTLVKNGLIECRNKLELMEV